MGMLSRRRLEELLEQYLGEQGPGFRLEKVEKESKAIDAGIDFIAVLKSPKPHGKPALLVVEVKSRGEPSFLSQAATQLRAVDLDALKVVSKKIPKDWISRVVIAPYITERGRELLKRNGIGYMDYAGNCSIQLGTYFIERAGHKKPSEERRVARRFFSPKASRVSRALLEEPKRTWALKELAETIGLSLGYVHAIVTRLQEQEFVSRNDDYRVALEKPVDLLEAWSEAYSVSQNETHAYYAFDRSFTALARKIVEVSEKRKLEYALTLHAGASLLAPFVRFNETHFYVRASDIEKWIKALDLRPAETGANVLLIAPRDGGVFYRKQQVGDASVVCTTQLYLDLVNYPARGREQAEFLRKEKMEF